jgi:predicted ATPase/DNA-binding CsgD family transcriptional regulator
MTHVSPIIQNGILTNLRDGSPVQIVVDSSDWYAWLQTASTFTFRSEHGSFTAHKERAGNRRGRAYWRAYCTRQGKLHRAYLGQSEELALEQLQSVAAVLASKGEGDNSLDVPGLEGGTRSSSESSSRGRTHPRRAITASAPHETALSKLWLSSLPVPLTALIGREQEVQTICGLLSHPEVRLLTITGTGGVGKTRLALEAARALRVNFTDGTCFVPLAPVSDHTRVLAAIAQALGLREVAALPLEEQMHAALRELHLLLLLDNFEQVVKGAPQLASLLASCPRLSMLITSRAALHLSGEREFPVPPLVVPNLAQLPSPETLAQEASVRLFVLRTQAILPTFHVTPANARAIAEICVHLDGLPLAIELAAARSKLLPPQALLKRLSHRLEVLTGGAQDLPDRQQTLRNTLQWSYDLLTEQEEHLFRWLSIFVGGCTLEAAETFCQAGQKDGNQTDPVLEGVASLLDKSLLQQTEREGEAPRLVMLETLREFGLECLRGSGELEAAREAHARYYLALAEQATSEMRDPKQTTWLQRLELEHDNLRAALEWALEEVEEQETERKELALRLCAALKTFWRQYGHYGEAHAFLERTLARSQGECLSLRARVLQAASYFASFRGDHIQAEALAQQSLALCRELDDAQGIARSLHMLASARLMKGKTAEKLSLLEEALRLTRQTGKPGEVARVLHSLAFEFSMHGEYARGQALFEEALVLFRERGDELGAGNTLLQSAIVLWFTLGDAATIRQRLHEGRAFIEKVGSRHWSAWANGIAALVALREGEIERASILAREALGYYRERDARWYIAWMLHVLGRVDVQRGDLTAARSSYQESLTLGQQLSEEWITAFNLEGLAGVAVVQGAYEWAAQLLGAAEALREAIAVPLMPADRASYEQTVHVARARLGASAFASAWQEGRAMTPEQVLAAQGYVTISLPTPTGSRSTLPVMTSPSYPSGLTAREVEVLRLVAQGLTDAQVAEQLVISPRTVNGHLRSIYSKIGVTSRSAATRYAVDHHLA